MNEPTMLDGVEELGIFERDADAWVDSQDVASRFEKRHADVIRAVEKAIAETSTTFNQRNFALVKQKDAKGEMRKAYRLNRKSFAYVVMSFTGAKAAEWKEAYIEAFEIMADLIFTRRITADGYKAMSLAVQQCIGDAPHNYMREADRVNLAVLGMRSKQIRQAFEVPGGKNPRDIIPRHLLEKIDSAQKLNGQLIRAGLSGDERDRVLMCNYAPRSESDNQ